MWHVQMTTYDGKLIVVCDTPSLRKALIELWSYAINHTDEFKHEDQSHLELTWKPV